MFKTESTQSGMAYHGGGFGTGTRDTGFPSAYINVSDVARTQPLPLDMNTIRQFSFGQPERSPLPERPSTSSGPTNTAGFVLRRDAWKRETRDDLDFPVPSYAKQGVHNDFTSYGGLPTPDSSPRDLLPPRKDSLALSSTPDLGPDTEGAMSPREMEIGMAIGSPTQAPPSWQPQVYGHYHTPSPDPIESSMDARARQPLKQKSKWKVFGGLFSGKKTTPQAQNFYQLQADRSPEVARFEQPSRGWTVSERSTTKKKPEPQRSHTGPSRYDAPFKRTDNPEIIIDGSRVEESPQSQSQESAPRMLDVDIPNVEMERYSVMFGSLLGRPANSRPSLLVRRQATLDRLKMVHEELAIKEQEIEEKEKAMRQPRRATSPQPTRSPAFSLFPNTPSRDSRVTRAQSPNLNGRLVRSNTSPAALSPSRPSFAPGPDNETHATLLEPGPHIPIGIGRYDSDASFSHESPASVMPKPLLINKKPDLRSVVKMAQSQAANAAHEAHTNRSFTPDESHLSLSPDSDIYEASPLPNSTKRVAPEPSWQAIPRTTPGVVSISGSATSQSDHSASASGSSTISSTSVSLANFPTPHSASSNVQTLQPHQFQEYASPRIASPPPTGLAKSLPTPMSKFTAPPQAHKTRGRSQTTTQASPSVNTNSQIPRPSSRHRAGGPPDISGPTNLSAVPLPVQMPVSGGSVKEKDVSIARDRRRPSEEDHVSDDEARIERLADVSIARQISVSRQQRQLLVPIKGSLKSKPKQVDNASPQSSSPGQGTRIPIRSRASTVSTANPGSRVHDRNFPSPGQKLGLSGVNVASVASPLSAVEQAVGGLSPSPSMSNLQKLKREVEKERKEVLHEGVRQAMPTLVIVGGNGSTAREEWEGAVVNSRKEKSDGIAERRRKARAERLGTVVGEERKGHGYTKSEKVIVERIS